MFQDSTVTLDQMLAKCKATKLPEMSHPINNFEAHVSAYEGMLLGMPRTMNMIGGFVRPHLIWTHMLAATADVRLDLSRLKNAQLRSIATHLEMPPVPSFCATTQAGRSGRV